VLFAFLAAATCVPAQTDGAVPASEDIVARMAQAQDENRARFLPYVITRDYKLFDTERPLESKSRVTAEITVVPPDFKRCRIESTDGSGWGEKVVRKMLDGEVAFAKDSRASDFTRDNYDFLFLREEQVAGQRCYVFELLPKRQSKDLLRGTIWVDAATYLPERVEGEPAKSLSWWLKDVRIVLAYGYAGPMWLQIFSEASASVRILGHSTIDSQDVKYQIGGSAPASLTQTTVSAGKMTAAEQQ
jgi:hypothetical protein